MIGPVVENNKESVKRKKMKVQIRKILLIIQKLLKKLRKRLSMGLNLGINNFGNLMMKKIKLFI